MKKIIQYLLSTFIVAFALSCEKITQPNLPNQPDVPVIYVSGIVTDVKTLNPIDSANISLDSEPIVAPGITTPIRYSLSDKNGNFSFSFNPSQGCIYRLTITAPTPPSGVVNPWYGTVYNTIAYQNFNVPLLR